MSNAKNNPKEEQVQQNGKKGAKGRGFISD
jgi:hypothetical protein